MTNLPNRGLCDCPPDTRGDACNGTCKTPRQIRAREDVPDLRAERDRLRAAVDAALALHRPCSENYKCPSPEPTRCCECGHSYPCVTRRALTDADLTEEDK